MNQPALLTCAASDCEESFYPVVPNQKFCCSACGNRERVRQCRDRHRKRGGNGGGGDDGGGGLFATIGGAVEYGGNDFVSDKSRYSVKPAGRKPPENVSQPLLPLAKAAA